MPAFEERPPEEAEGLARGEYDLAVEENTRIQDQQEIEDFRRNLSWALGEVPSSGTVASCFFLFVFLSLTLLKL
jgi:hypothetical protein